MVADKTLLIGIDPAQKRSAVSYRGTSRKTKKVTKGVKAIVDILDSSDIESLLHVLNDHYICDRVCVAVEYPKGNFGSSQTVRAAANTYIRLVKRVWKKAEFTKVEPKTWQHQFGFKDRGKMTTKEFSLFICEKAYNWDLDGDHDKADAVLILEWLKIHA